MIWMNAATERPLAASLIKDALAAVLHVDTNAIEVVYDISQAQGKAVLCIIHEGDGSDFSQTISVYLDQRLAPPSLLKGGSLIAAFTKTAMLLPDDDTADPYSFVLAGGSGTNEKALVDPDQLDHGGRYVIVPHHLRQW
ncbi:hypothetical protein [Agrobacterium tumefaciens]|uniref:hypothetical protein n=1 Tax=Agrobacterium tumefaciens TaxID=358 RepID=UPI000ADB7B96|nr:hypothetical protein [Agrobacterium tumefaciens]